MQDDVVTHMLIILLIEVLLKTRIVYYKRKVELLIGGECQRVAIKERLQRCDAISKLH